MSKREWRLFVEDILESIDLINQYVLNMNFEAFRDDRKTVDAVVRNLEIIGEASKYIPEEIKKRFSTVDWEGIVGLRNRIVHEYFGISLTIIWKIVKDEINGVEEQMKKILELNK